MLQNLRVQAHTSAAADLAKRWMTSLWIAVVVGCIYMLSAKMSLALLTPDGVAVFWPAAGVAAGTLIAIGPHVRWPVVIGTMVATIIANLLGDRNIWSSIVFALCNAGEALLAAGVIERSFGFPFDLDRLRHVLGLLGAAILATAVSGIGGTLGFVLFHESAASIFATWQNWFASDALGIITIAPLFIGLASVARRPAARGETVEGFIALALLIVMSVVVIALPQEPWATAVPIALFFPVLLWIAARCHPVFAAAAAFIVTLAIVGTTTLGIGYFGGPGLPMAERVLAARAGILAIALCAYVLAALFAERRQHERALAESEARVQEALTAGAVTTFVWDVGTNASQRSVNAAQILGFDPRQSFSPTSFLSHVHRDDRPRFKALVRGLDPEHPGYTATFRFKRSDGREVWLEETANAEFDAMRRPIRVKGLTLDVTTRKEFDDRQSMLVAALGARANNLLERVSVVARQTRASSHSLDEYIPALDGRIRSMADAHALLSQNRWNGADLAELIRRQLAPHASDVNATVSGPDVALTAEEAQTLAQVLHELTTNAANYGALSTPHGRVEVSWGERSRANPARLCIEWREIGGPAVTPSPDCKYGVSVIRDLIPRELGGSVGLAFAPSGICCRIEILSAGDGEKAALGSGAALSP
jgi:PAS domain S-box-containing protein